MMRLRIRLSVSSSSSKELSDQGFLFCQFRLRDGGSAAMFSAVGGCPRSRGRSRPSALF